MNLDKGSSSGLPPDWIAINRTTGEPQKVSAANLTTNFSYDALRTPWRVALDYQWFKEPRAKSYLDKLGFLNTQWQERGKIVSVYSHEGSIVSDQEAPATYGGTIGYFLVSNPEKAKEVYEQKLKSLYSEDENKFNPELSYYDANWVWFGMGLYNDLLPNLAKH